MIWVIVGLVVAALAVASGAFSRSQGLGRARSDRRLRRSGR